jgi:hypothetical protein
MLLVKRKEKEEKFKQDWWGYVHENGSIHVKRYFNIGQLMDAEESDFVKRIVYPFKSINKQEATLVIFNKLSNEKFRKRERIGKQGDIDNSGNRTKSNYRLEA